MLSRRVIQRALLLAALVAGSVFVREALWRPLDLVGAAPDDGYVRARGVVHVHTTASDGGGSPASVVAAAQQAGLDFLFITDHNNLLAKSSEGWHERLLVGVGTEISTASGHLLALGLDAPAFRFWGDPRAALDDVRALGGVAFAAHPDSPRPDLRWTAWDEPGAWGLEIFNGDSQWRAAGAWRGLRTLLTYPANADRALLVGLSSSDGLLRRWDALLRVRDVPALAGADAHGRIGLGRARGDDGQRTRGPSLRWPAYTALFRQMRNHVLLDAPLSGDAARDLRALAQALGRGRSYSALDALAPGDGFSFTAHGPGVRATMGDTVAPAPSVELRAGGRLPAGAHIVLLRDGVELRRGEREVRETAPAPGVYRVEVRLDGWPLPWIVSNPIYVFDAAAQAARRAAAAWPAEPEAGETRRVIEGFEGTTVFQVEVDPASSVSQPLVVDVAAAPADASGTGPTGQGLGRVAFQLGRPRPGGPPHPWCALMSRMPYDLGGTQGVALSVKADGVYRFAVLLRDENPRGSDEGQESWLASVRTSTSWRRIALPWSRFRSLDAHSDGSLDLGRVRALGLVIDDLALPPGTQGTLWIDDVVAY